MPFAKQDPRVFNKQNIEAIDPSLTGVYGIFNQNYWIYVGKGNLRKRLSDHLNGDNPDILAWQPTHYVDEIHNDPNMTIREKALIIECQTKCNVKVG